MALSLLDSAISSTDANVRIVKAVDEVKDFISTVHKNALKVRSVELYFKK
jgi:hypothetical protein